ncbi:MAG: type VI secretion system tip protein TssI/VgrG [Thermodesulfobacteriota bacterium]|nr:type VI secretion system tip protein TssI/VgrG [Thermodesulfobacteriota bacterium]
MTFAERKEFRFVSAAEADDTFEVVSFRGAEGISRLYEFDITLSSEDPEIDLKEVLQNPATFTVMRADQDDLPIHGVLAQFEQLHEANQRIFYRAVLVPRLWQASLYRENQLFLDKTVPDIIEEILSQTGLTTDDYELRLTGQYAEWEYICQYGETDFDFISRWMEREGIYYYFEQTEEFEKLIITDNSTAHEDVSGMTSIPYSPPSALIPDEEEVVREIICRQRMLPRRVILRDYNYRRPSLELRGEAEVDSQGRGDVYIYGEHFKTTDEGNALAAIRAEEIRCREVIFTGESTAAHLRPGFIFELTEHYRESYNQRGLITEVEHEGSQPAVLLDGLEEEPAEEEGQLSYVSRFEYIPADVQYRPERQTPKPRFNGTMNARVDATGDGQYAEVDEEGRYKIRLCFDQSDREDARASRWVRMAQPYAGADYGMHFPLHRDTEVLVTFVDGDPDRPIISGSVPNPETASPVNSNNQTQCMLRTGGGNQIRIEDGSGGQQIHLSSPTSNSIISLGAKNEGNIFLRSDGTWVSKIGEDRTTHIGGDSKLQITGDDEQIIEVNQGVHVQGKQVVKVDGARKVEVSGGEDYTVSPGRSLTVNGINVVTTNNEIRATTSNAGEHHHITGGRLFNIRSGGDTYTVTGQRKVTVNGNETYTIKGDRTVSVDGNHKGLSAGETTAMYSGRTHTLYAALQTSAGLDAKFTASLAAVIDIFVGLKFAVNASASIEMNYGFRAGRAGMDLFDGNLAIFNRTGISLDKSMIKFLG